MMKTKHALLIAYGLASIAVASPAASALITFTDEASFQAAAGPLTLENFNSTATATLASPTAPAFSTSIGGFTLSGNGNGDYVAIAAGSSPSNIDGTNFLYWSQYEPSGGESGDGLVGPQFNFSFSSPITAFGFDWTDGDPTDSYQVAINGSIFSSPPFNLSGLGSGFFGVVATGGETFTTVAFTQNASGGIVDPFGADDVQFSAASIPEPATLALFGIGLAGLGLRRRKRGV